MVGGIGIEIHHTKFRTNRKQKISFFLSQLFVIVINLELSIPLLGDYFSRARDEEHQLATCPEQCTKSSARNNPNFLFLCLYFYKDIVNTDLDI